MCLRISGLSVVLTILSSAATAYPVTYNFGGHITSYTATSSTFNLSAGDAFTGQLTYDADYHGTDPGTGQPWPTSAALLSWSIHVDGEIYRQNIINPNVQSITAFERDIYFFDEQPSSTADAPFFDQGGIRLEFLSQIGSSNLSPGNNIPETLPLADFLSGYFFLNGHGELRGAISLLSLAVPEPASILLVTLGLAGASTSRNRRSLKTT